MPGIPAATQVSATSARFRPGKPNPVTVSIQGIFPSFFMARSGYGEGHSAVKAPPYPASFP